MDVDLSALNMPESVPVAVQRALASMQMLIDGASLDRAVDQLSVVMTVRWQNSNPLLVTLLPDAMVFSAMLQRRVIFPLQVMQIVQQDDGVQVIGGAEQQTSLQARDVVLVMAHYDPDTAAAVSAWAQGQQAAQIQVVALCAADNEVSAALHIAGAHANATIIGSGLTWRGYGGNFPGIYALPDADNSISSIY